MLLNVDDACTKRKFNQKRRIKNSIIGSAKVVKARQLSILRHILFVNELDQQNDKGNI